MRFHWLKDKDTQKCIRVYWKKGTDNEADYFTKHHATTHHRAVRNRYVKDKMEKIINHIFTVCPPYSTNVESQRGCVDTGCTPRKTISPT